MVIQDPISHVVNVTLRVRDEFGIQELGESFFTGYDIPFRFMRDRLAARWTVEPEMIKIMYELNDKLYDLKDEDTSRSLGLDFSVVISVWLRQ